MPSLAADRAAPRPDGPAAGAPLLIAVASGKGGVGKTWFAITLAQALGFQSLANRAPRVLLFDADLGLANVDIQLGLNPAHDLGAVLAGEATLPQAVCMVPNAGFSVLAGRSGSGSLAGLPVSLVDRLLAQLGALPFDDIVLDLGAGLEAATRQMAARAGLLLVMATDEPTSLTDAYAVLKLHAADAPRAAARIVINQAKTAASGQRTYETLARACAKFLGGTPPLAGIIRRDEHVRDAIRWQTPLLTRHPNCAAATDVRRIAEDLLRLAAAKPPAAGAPPPV